MPVEQHRRRALWTSCVLILASMVAAGCRPVQTWSGTISDDICGVEHLFDEHGLAETPRECALRCARDGAPFVFVMNRTVYKIARSDSEMLSPHAGMPVEVSGSIDGDTITISTVRPLTSSAP